MYSQTRSRKGGYACSMPRRTIQQEAVWDVLASSDGPLLPEEILERAQEDCPTLGQATVYRALKRLEAEAQVERVIDLDGRARFEVGQDHHHHFHCRSCDRVFDVPGCSVKSTKALNPKLPKGFALEGHEVWLRGLCASCA